MAELSFEVDDLPPTKNEAKSLLAPGHTHASRVRALLVAAQQAMDFEPGPLLPGQPLALEVVESPHRPKSDATNHLGAIGDVLQDKANRPNLSLNHPEHLAQVCVFADDSQLQEVHYRWDQAPRTRYLIRVWER